ncbi:MAG TPA: MarR family winged helix-turn-helix transcriptional regulator [Micrococcaceae bacterium]|jgi:DNA-binding MarR family transcriptional regulator|nr:MarR family winged helix-turn-helix transcriptional regulator [Micrococcaceae bacterium]
MAPPNSVTVESSATADRTGWTPPRLAGSSISNDLGFLLAKLHAAGSVLNNAALAQFGLKERSYSVLALAGGDLEPSQREMAEFLSLDPSQVVALIDELEQRGLVKRTVGRTDRRHKLVAVTAKGRKVLVAARQAAQEAEATQLAMLAPQEVTALKAILGKAVWVPGSPA